MQLTNARVMEVAAEFEIIAERNVRKLATITFGLVLKDHCSRSTILLQLFVRIAFVGNGFLYFPIRDDSTSRRNHPRSTDLNSRHE